MRGIRVNAAANPLMSADWFTGTLGSQSGAVERTAAKICLSTAKGRRERGQRHGGTASQFTMYIYRER